MEEALLKQLDSIMTQHNDLSKRYLELVEQLASLKSAKIPGGMFFFDDNTMIMIPILANPDDLVKKKGKPNKFVTNFKIEDVQKWMEHCDDLTFD